MKIAYIILAHKNPEQVARLIQRLDHSDVTFYVHVDKGAPDSVYGFLVQKFHDKSNLVLTERHRSKYASFGIVAATVAAVKRAFNQKEPFDYVINLSGEDYPLKTNDQISLKLKENNGRSCLWHFQLPFEGEVPERGHVCQRLNRVNFWHFRIGNRLIRMPVSKIRGQGKVAALARLPLWGVSRLTLPETRPFLKGMTPFGGGQWWCLSYKHARYVVDFVEENKSVLSFFKYANYSDELFFHTILLNSRHRHEISNDDLRYIKFTNKDSHPDYLDITHWDDLRATDKLFGRKFDESANPRILDMIDKNLLV